MFSHQRRPKSCPKCINFFHDAWHCDPGKKEQRCLFPRSLPGSSTNLTMIPRRGTAETEENGRKTMKTSTIGQLACSSSLVSRPGVLVARARERANYWAAHNCRKLRNLSRRTLEANAAAAGRSLIGPLDCHLPACVAKR